MTETTDLAKNVIVNYKDVTSWILLGIIILIGIIRYFQSVKLSETIETFKSELSKKEIKFTRHTEMQIDCIKDLYNLVVSFDFSYQVLTSPKYLRHNLFKKNINSFIDSHSELILFGHRNKILITDEIINQYNLVFENYQLVKELCEGELSNISEFEEANSTNDIQYLYTNDEDEIASIKIRAERLNTNREGAKLHIEIKRLRTTIENYFKELVG